MSGRIQRRRRQGWWRRLWVQVRDGCRLRWRNLRNATPFAHVRLGLNVLLLLSGAALLAILVAPQYDRALVLSGRTEVLSMRLDAAAFGSLGFDPAIYLADSAPDLDAPTPRGRLQLEVLPGTTIRFVRIGRGAVRLTFTADPSKHTKQDCGPGLLRVGSATLGEATSALCDAATVIVPLAMDADPLVVGLSGGLVVGEEVSQGAGPRPILLEATASLLVKYDSRLFRWICSRDTFEHLCDRFVANSVVLSPGDSVRADQPPADPRSTAGLGFIRIDPSEWQSGMLFNLAARITAFEVQRLQGGTYTVRESLFDVIEKSPLVRTLSIILAAFGLIWSFLRLIAGRPGAAALLAAALLGAPGLAQAQQALIRAEETGQALLRSRGDRCYAVTPVHVLGAETSALVTAPGRERGEGDLLRRIPAAPEAVALLSLRGIPLALCPAFEGALSLDLSLRAHAGATLRLVRADGSTDRVALMLGSVEVETLEVRSDAGSLAQGMSGGTVLVADQPVGLLVDVTDEGRTGRVARLDRIFERLAPHLTNAAPVVAAHAPSGSVPYDILRSNAAPVELGNKASSLQGDGPGPWRVPAEGRVEMILKLNRPFSGVELDLTGLPDPPQTVELLGGRGERGPWQSLATLSLEPGDKLEQRRFPPVGLGYVLLRAHGAASRKTLAITRMSFLPR